MPRIFPKNYKEFESLVPEAAKAARQREAKEQFDQAPLDQMAMMMERYQRLAEMSYVLAVPSRLQSNDWRSVGQSLSQSITEREIDPVTKLYAVMGDAYRTGDSAVFNQAVNQLTDRIAQQHSDGITTSTLRIFV